MTIHYIYGYKAHVGSDLTHGFILGGHVTGANLSDTKELEKVLQILNLPDGAIMTADKGYASQSNRTMLKQIFGQKASFLPDFCARLWPFDDQARNCGSL